MPSNYDYIPGAQGTRNSLQGGSSITSAGRPVPQPYGNRYIPPTFNFGRDPSGGRPNYAEMDWNNIQGYNLPQHGNNPFQQEYMGGLRDMLGSFQQRYPQQQPRMPQFGGGDPYNMYDPAGGGQGGEGQFDPRVLMAMMYRGMSPEQMFGQGERRRQPRRPTLPQAGRLASGFGTGGEDKYGPSSGLKPGGV